ncbi:MULTISPECIES: winged helix-turn-helix domain-containing protein [unclassified Variovorax]|uniref:winged helix-turn-helix domain-containing protein n=1 Tax=unclassified Variovorax TaxID=663243 RepID=UPI00076D1066|nr:MULTISPECIES: winged helix-turn-helix domain-containing protein [unclassified Variovorax]KWT97601.1 Response regulator receiver:Transcriptional regulatory protein, C-terminal [Variovorax sp. WDL1]
MLDDEPREIESIQRVMATSGHECHGYANGKSLPPGLRVCHPFQRELVYGPYHFSPLAGTIRLHGEPVRLKRREYDLALLLFRNIGRLLPREHLMLTIWGQELEPGSRSLDMHMSRLRARLDLRPNGLILASVYGLGYRLEYIAGDEAEPPDPLAGATE